MTAHKSKFEFKRTMVGPFFYVDHEAAAAHLDVCPEQLRNYRRDGKAPADLIGKIKDMGELLVFPLDEALPQHLIGRAAYEAYQELRANRCSRAAAIAGDALQPGAIDSDTGEPLLLTSVQRLFLRLIRGVAFARNKRTRQSHLGLPALRLLRNDVAREMRRQRIDERDDYWKVWSYLSAMTLGYELCYFLMKIGAGWFRGKHYVAGAVASRRNAQAVLKHARRLKAFDEMLAERHVANLIAWNVLQIAALANCDASFIEALSSLHTRCRASFRLLLEELEKDNDTRPMMSHYRVALFISRTDIPALKD